MVLLTCSNSSDRFDTGSNIIDLGKLKVLVPRPQGLKRTTDPIVTEWDCPKNEADPWSWDFSGVEGCTFLVLMTLRA